jgi:dihydrofolate synthase/folylpolyglutamate synthase
MDYTAALTAIDALEGRGMKLGLERIETLLAALGNPHRGLRGALVAGTNGKGSVSSLLESMARAAGRSTVLLTKPHLVSWRERIAVNGIPVSEQRFADLIAAVLEATGAMGDASPTAFEVLTAAGILAARDTAPDVLICEVGLGGRLDSTNVLDLGIAVITGIAVDHRAELGDEIAGIAAEKAAIIKPGNDVVTAATGIALEVISQAAARAPARSLSAVGTALPFAGESRGADGVVVELSEPRLRVATPLIGPFQERNLAVAAQTARVLSRRDIAIGDAAIVAGAATVSWPGRMQWIPGKPPLLVDGCHNPDAVAAMVVAAAPLVAGRRAVAVFGSMADKDVAAMLAALRPLTGEVVFTRPASPRAADPDQLAALWGAGAATAPGVAAAIAAASGTAGPVGVVVACGSLYVAGEALEAAAASGRVALSPSG